jgi:hypothetical protein
MLDAKEGVVGGYFKGPVNGGVRVGQSVILEVLPKSCNAEGAR